MTVVARLVVNTSPLLVGDLLLSGDEVPGLTMNVPTIGSISSVFPQGSLIVPTQMRQKIAIVSDNLVVGWSGGRSAASFVIRGLIDRNRNEPFTLDSLMQHFRNLPESVWKQGCGFVGFIKDPNGVAQFGFRCSEFPTTQLGKVGLLGSGTEHLRPFLQNVPLGHSSREPNDLERAFFYGLLISGVFLSAEITTHETLLNYFGAGYEIASLVNGKFQKLDDITYLFWHCDIGDSELRGNLHQICKYSYVNDALLIRTATLSQSAKETPVAVKESLYAVTPVYRDVTDGEFSSVIPPSLDSKWLCNYLIVPHSSEIAVFVSVHYCGQDDVPIRFIEEEGRLTVALKKAFTDRMFKQAFDTYERQT